MKNILVPIGSSENARNTLQYAIDFAKKIDAKVYIFRAYNLISKAGTHIEINEIIERETNLYLNSILKLVETKNVPVKLITVHGIAIDSIEDINRKMGIDLIIMGPKSNSLKNDVFLGSTTGSIVKQTEIPSLVVPENYKFKTIENALIAFKSGIINKKGVLKPLKKFTDNANLLLVNTPLTQKKDIEIDQELEKVKLNFSIIDEETTFKGVKVHLEKHSTDFLCVFRRKRGFFKKLWEKDSILKSEFNCEVPLLILSGKI